MQIHYFIMYMKFCHKDILYGNTEIIGRKSMNQDQEFLFHVKTLNFIFESSYLFVSSTYQKYYLIYIRRDICCCAARSCYYCNIVSQRSLMRACVVYTVYVQAKETTNKQIVLRQNPQEGATYYNICIVIHTCVDEMVNKV